MSSSVTSYNAPITTLDWSYGLPKVIQLGAFPITIEVHHKPIINERDAHGLWDCEHQKIILAEDMPSNAFAVNILFHEIGHAIYWMFGKEGTGAIEEEEIVTIMGVGWTMIFDQNPHLFDWARTTLGNSE